ncbi:MAG: STAS domain-containing protein [Fibrobacterota bacterium]
MDGPDVQIQADERGTFFYFKVSGAFCARNVIDIRKHFEDAQGLGHSKFALDLSGVIQLDSTGLGLIVNFNKTLIKQEGVLLIVNPSNEARNSFEVSNTCKWLQIRDNIENIDALFD